MAEIVRCPWSEGGEELTEAEPGEAEHPEHPKPSEQTG